MNYYTLTNHLKGLRYIQLLDITQQPPFKQTQGLFQQDGGKKVHGMIMPQ